MPRVLFLVSSADSMPLADGTPYHTGYFAEEALTPYERFIAAGVDVVVATPDGRPPTPDPYGLEPMFHYPDEDEDFLHSVIRSFRHDVDDIRVTLQHLTELDLISARRIFEDLKANGSDPEDARTWIEGAARTAWSENRNFIEVLSADDRVTALITAERIQTLAAQVQGDSAIQASAVAEKLAFIPEFEQPAALADLSDEELGAFDALFLPGGHGPMADMADNDQVRRVLRVLQEREAVIAALCHGPAALLSAGGGASGEWLFDGYKLTAFSDQEEDQTRMGQRGMAWYLETALKNAGAVFDDAPSPWVSHVVVDRNLVTAQNPQSTDAAVDAVLQILGLVGFSSSGPMTPAWPEHPRDPMLTAAELGAMFFERLAARDVDGALGLMDPGTEVDLLPLRVRGTAKAEGQQFLHALFEAFPDLRVSVRSLFAGSDDVVVAEVKMEGTQAADFYGVVNQEKHIDVDQAWRLRVVDGQIVSIRAYWCQAQLYRRLAVKRLDHITITA